MREILFKAKRLDTGEWLEGYIHKCEGEFVISNNDGLGEFINADTLCQYTGLTDRNGRKIWENDVLRYSYDYPGSPYLKANRLTDDDIKYNVGAVFWHDWRGTWAVCGKGKSRMDNQDIYVYSRNPNRVEVIGNIFDHPELLEGGAE